MKNYQLRFLCHRYELFYAQRFTISVYYYYFLNSRLSIYSMHLTLAISPLNLV